MGGVFADLLVIALRQPNGLHLILQKSHPNRPIGNGFGIVGRQPRDEIDKSAPNKLWRLTERAKLAAINPATRREGKISCHEFNSQLPGVFLRVACVIRVAVRRR